MTTQKQQGIKKQLTKGFVKVAIIGAVAAVIGIVALLIAAIQYEKALSQYGFTQGVVSLKRLLNQSNLKSWSSKMIKKSLEAYFFTLKNKIVFCKKQFQNMSVFCFVSTEIV